MENDNKKENKTSDNEIKKNQPKNNFKTTTNKVAKKKKPSWIIWPIKILVIAISLSLAFSILSGLVLSNVGLVVSILLIVLLLIIGIVSDMIGVAIAACPIEPFTAMSSRKVKGAQVSIFLIKNAEKVSSICNDVVGDICGIISGAAGSAIAIKLITSSMGNSIQILITASVSALIAGLTIFGKAICKKYAMDNSTKVVLGFGKILSLFSFKRK